jgi:hypothetical protein
MRLVEYVERIGEMRNPYRILAEKLEGKRPVGSPRHGWKEIDIRDQVGTSAQDSCGLG